MRVKALIVVLLLSQGRATAASAPDHFIHGFVITGYVLSLAGESRATVLWGSAISATLMTLPDVIGMFGPHQYMHWPVYTWAHERGNPLVMIPQYAFHLFIDTAFHRFEGDTWWPRMAGICVAMWVVEVVLIYVFFKYVLPDE